MRRICRSNSLLLGLAAVVVAFASDAVSQTYVEIAPGSRYVCGLMPNGQNFIFLSGGSNTDIVGLKEAKGSVNRDLRKIEGRLERLHEIKVSLNDGGLSRSELKGFTGLIKAADPDSKTPIPPGKKERKELLNALIAKLKIEAQNKKHEIKKLDECSKGKRPGGPAGDLRYEFTKLRAADDGIYITILLSVPAVLNPEGKPYPQRWFCIKADDDPRGQPLLFTDNPCFQGEPPFSKNLCPQFAKKGFHVAFYKFRIFIGVHMELDDPRVIQAEGEFQEKYAGGIRGRPRASLADNCQDIFNAPN